MKQTITCNQGRCFEEGTIESEFDSLFDESNIVDQIRKDIFKKGK